MTKILSQLGLLILLDLGFILALMIGVIVPLRLFSQAALAVLKRNFVSYFSNPTGYVFLCLFMFLSSIAAFWPHAFFATNLATLDQLNKWFPFIMVFFIPAITMNIWAEERRQGTDELLLTLPAADFDIVIGKYLAAAATFTASLVFSQLFNFWVLASLANGDLDTPLFFVTYLGYWMIGLAMLSVGMVASFMTKNVTVSFVLGALFNAPLVFAIFADTILSAAMKPHLISRWSISDRFDDFGRGVTSLSSISYFALLVVIGVYISMVLIGSRHWARGLDEPGLRGKLVMVRAIQALVLILSAIAFILFLVFAPDYSLPAGIVLFLLIAGAFLATNSLVTGRSGPPMLSHYLVRVLAMILVLAGLNIFFSNHDLLRADFSEKKTSSLLSDSQTLIQNISKHPVRVQAFLSAQVPDEYIKTKLTLINTLKELQRTSGGKIIVELHDNLEEFSPEASLAEERFGIKRRTVVSHAQGEIRQVQFVLGAAFTQGLEKIVIPFFGNGTPIEAEVVRAIDTVGSGTRKTIGIVTTDARINGGFDFAGGRPQQIPKLMILDELERQYRLEEVNLASPLDVYDDKGNLRFAALLVVQPSSLDAKQLNNLIVALKAGQPSLIFEDPSPQLMPQIVGTSQDKPGQGGMMGMGAPPQPKGIEFRKLWEALDIAPVGDDGAQAGRAGPPKLPGNIVLQWFNPYRKIKALSETPVYIFTGVNLGAVFNPEEPAVANFNELVFLFAGGVEKAGKNKKLEFTELVTTSDQKKKLVQTGYISLEDLELAERSNIPTQLTDKMKGSGRRFTLAAWIRGEPEEQPAEEPKKTGAETAAKTPPKPLNVIYIADVDILNNFFVTQRNEPQTDVENFNWDNVPFLLNMVDAVAGDKRFLGLRQHKPKHSTLQRIDDVVTQAYNDEQQQIKTYDDTQKENRKTVEKEVENLKDAEQKFRDEVEKRSRDGNPMSDREITERNYQINMQQATAVTKLQQLSRKQERDKNQNMEKIRRKRDQKIRDVQNEFKLFSAVAPPVLPLLVGMLVFVYRLLREREGIAKSRLKY